MFSFSGPKSDHTSGKGKYMFIESSAPRSKGHKALMQYDFSTLSSDSCFSMFYHMYGSDAGSLSIYAYDSKRSESTLWTASGTRGDVWRQLSVTVPSNTKSVSIAKAWQ